MWVCGQCNEKVERRGWRCARGHWLLSAGGKEGTFGQGFWRGFGVCLLLIVVIGSLQPYIAPHLRATHPDLLGGLDILLLLALLVIGIIFLSSARKWQRTGGPLAWAAPRKRGAGAGILAVVAVIVLVMLLELLVTKHFF